MSGADAPARSLFGMTATDTQLLLVKLVALRASIDYSLGGGIRPTGDSLEHTVELILRFYDLRDALMVAERRVFGDVPRHHFPANIRSQADDLGKVRRDLEHLLVLGEQAGFHPPAPVTAVVPAATTPKSGRALAVGKWFGNHVAAVIVGVLGTLIAAYLGVRYGLGK